MMRARNAPLFLEMLRPATGVMGVLATLLLGCDGPYETVTTESGSVAAQTQIDADGPMDVVHHGDGCYSAVLRSPEMAIERLYTSMDGPSRVLNFTLADEHTGELLWLTGMRNRAIESASGDALSQEFLCHSNLSLPDPRQLQRDFDSFAASPNLEPRLLTLIQGQNEVELPAGFGLPMLAGEPLEFFSMAINSNRHDVPFGLQVETTIDFVRDGEATQPIRPLFRRRLFNFVQIDPQNARHSGHGEHATGNHGDHGEHGGQGEHSEHGSGDHGSGDHGSGDHASGDHGNAAHSAMMGATLGKDGDNTYAMHWVVPPGRHAYRNRVDTQLDLTFDTSLHYATAHLHPYGESLRLIDLTTDEVILELAAHAYEDRKGIEEMESFSSLKGISLRRDHEYELVTVYVNTTDEPIDAMAILYLHLEDHAFDRRAAF